METQFEQKIKRKLKIGDKGAEVEVTVRLNPLGPEGNNLVMGLWRLGKSSLEKYEERSQKLMSYIIKDVLEVQNKEKKLKDGRVVTVDADGNIIDNPKEEKDLEKEAQIKLLADVEKSASFHDVFEYFQKNMLPLATISYDNVKDASFSSIVQLMTPMEFYDLTLEGVRFFFLKDYLKRTKTATKQLSS